MNTPLGRAAGNWLEVKESVACLESGTGFQPVSDSKRNATGKMLSTSDLRELVLACAAHLLVQTGKAKSSLPRASGPEIALPPRTAQKVGRDDSRAGSRLVGFTKKLTLDFTAPAVVELKASRGGFISKCDARLIGEVIRDLGGRLTKESVINHDVGVDRLAKPGELVSKGSICTHSCGKPRTSGSRPHPAPSCV